MLPKIDAISSLLPEIDAPNLLSSIGSNKQNVIEKMVQSLKGQHFQAEVVAKLPNEIYQVKISNLTINLKLPNNPQVGQKLQLTLLTLSPQLTFSIEGFGEVIVDDPVSSHQLMKRFEEFIKKSDINHLKSSSTNQTNVSNSSTIYTSSANSEFVQSSRLDLSETAKMISQLLQIPTPTEIATKANIHNGTPLLSQLFLSEQTKLFSSITTENKITNLLISQLKQHISSSGLFYESHVASWLNGQFQTQLLHQEPQAQLPIELSHHFLDQSNDVQYEKLVHLIHQQLEVNENQKVTWSGLLFANAPMEWVIEKNNHPRQNEQSQEDLLNNWNSTIRLSLPELGNLEIRINLQEQRLSLNIAVEQIDSAKLLKENLTNLSQSIKNFDTILQSIQVTNNYNPTNEK